MLPPIIPPVVVYVGLAACLLALFVASVGKPHPARVFFLLALRLAIGWHFLFEGLHKLHTTALGETETSKPFTAANYFNAGDGPFAEMARKQFMADPEKVYTARLAKPKETTPEEFRKLTTTQQAALCPVEAARLLSVTDDEIAKKQSEAEELKAAAEKLPSGTDAEKLAKAAAQQKAAAAQSQLDWRKANGERMKAAYAAWVYGTVPRDAKFKDVTGDAPATAEQWLDYVQLLEDELAGRKQRTKLALGGGNNLEVKRSAALRADLNAVKSDLAKATDDFLTDLRKNAGLTLEPPAPTGWMTLEKVNLLSRWGITAIGIGLLAGLFTRLSCLAGFGFLVMTYLTAPPWPWLPSPPPSEGNPLFINKNLIEAIALLVVLVHPTGRWLGLDALIGYVFAGRSK